MVFGNVPKLHALVGLLAATAAFPAGCSSDDFEGCEASRTCKPKNTGGASGSSGSSGTSGSGEGGDDAKGGASGTTSGGASGTSAGQSGEAGAMDGGRGGAGDDTTPPTIVSITPDDGDTDVERDVEVTVTFSEPIDESTVTSRSVKLEGPDGEVTGTLGVDGRVVTFVAEKPLYLLGDYTVTVGDLVADLAGNAIGEEASVGWKVRDGRWGAIDTPFGRTARYMGAFARNARGDMVIGGGQPSEPSTLFWAAAYAADKNQWTPADTFTLPQEGFSPSSNHGMAIDPEGRAALTWSTGTTAGWFRSSGEGIWEDASSLPYYANVAATTDGVATAVWLNNGTLNTRTLDLRSGAAGAITPLWSSEVETATDYLPVASLDRVALFERVPNGTGDQITVAWKDPISGWDSPEPVASASDISGVWLASSGGEGNIALIWIQGAQIWSRIYERGSEDWTRPLLVASATTTATFGEPQIAGSRIAMSLYLDGVMYGAYYEHGIGWIQSSFVELSDLNPDDPLNGAFGVAMSIDGRGNALAVGPTGSRRCLAGGTWEQTIDHHLALGEWRLWTATASDGTLTAVTNDLTAGGQLIPAVVRFE